MPTLHAKAWVTRETHKQFTMEWWTALFAHTRAENVRKTLTMQGSPKDSETFPPTIGSNTKKRKMSHIRPELPDYRLKGNKDDHQIVLGDRLRACAYCSYLSAINKLAGLPAEKPARSKSMLVETICVRSTCTASMHKMQKRMTLEQQLSNLLYYLLARSCFIAYLRGELSSLSATITALVKGYGKIRYHSQ